MTRTVKIRIAVAVDPSGDWYALGYPEPSDHIHGDCSEALQEGESRYWVTAELAVPEVAEVAGQVEPEE